MELVKWLSGMGDVGGWEKELEESLVEMCIHAGVLSARTQVEAISSSSAAQESGSLICTTSTLRSPSPRSQPVSTSQKVVHRELLTSDEKKDATTAAALGQLPQKNMHPMDIDYVSPTSLTSTASSIRSPNFNIFG